MNTIYIFVRGGVVQSVRSNDPAVTVHLIDYDDNQKTFGPDRKEVSEEDFEIARCGKTYDQIEAVTEEVL